MAHIKNENIVGMFYSFYHFIRLTTLNFSDEKFVIKNFIINAFLKTARIVHIDLNCPGDLNYSGLR